MKSKRNIDFPFLCLVALFVFMGGACNNGNSPSEEALKCEPMCEGKACGDNGCGGVCGECEGGRECNEAGSCICVKSSRAICDGIDLITTDSCGNREVHEACLYGCRGQKCAECKPLRTRTAVYSDFKAKNPVILISKSGPMIVYAKFSQERLGYTVLTESREEHKTLTGWGDKNGFFLDATWDKVTNSLVVSHWGEKDETLELTTEHPEVTTRTLEEMQTKAMYQAYSCIDTDIDGHFHVAWVECTSARSRKHPLGGWIERCEESKLRYGTNEAGRFKSEIVGAGVGAFERRCAIKVHGDDVHIAFHAGDRRMCSATGRAGQWELDCSTATPLRAAFDIDAEGKAHAAFSEGLNCMERGLNCSQYKTHYVTMGSWSEAEEIYTGTYPRGLAIALSPTGEPQVAIADQIEFSKTEIQHCDRRGSWSCVKVDDGESVGEDLSMLVSRSGKTHLVYTVEDQVVYAGGYQCRE